MANIDFALRTSAGSASLRRGTAATDAADLRLLLALDEFWGDAVPEKAPSTRVNRATTIRTPTKKSCCTVCTIGKIGFWSLIKNSFQISLIQNVVENLNLPPTYSQKALGNF